MAWCQCGQPVSTPYDPHFNEAIVAALKAAGALMPEEADEERRAISRYARERNATDALLQEALSVLGPLLEVPWWAYASYVEGPTRIGEEAHDKACVRLNDYKVTQERAASLAEKIEKAIGGEG